MTIKMQTEIFQVLADRGNGAYSKLYLHFARQGKGAEFTAAFDELVAAGKVEHKESMVKLIDPTPVGSDSDNTSA
ncbi:hypothetical protein K6W76_30340 [Burkholderia anthina]|uniref:hypothetical protein n=1 Tax=Burkholderia anthina TaxID=179879 RepID=UPI00158D2387|nr:hypothetical protein [Burkholderia anthina]MBY4870747.1 hypothetical protein [Burkholderia anthina]